MEMQTQNAHTKCSDTVYNHVSLCLTVFLPGEIISSSYFAVLFKETQNKSKRETEGLINQPVLERRSVSSSADLFSLIQFKCNIRSHLTPVRLSIH